MRFHIKIIVLSGLILLGCHVYAQEPTIGLLHWSSNAFDGYTLFSPLNNNNVYLINNCGEEINEWTFSEQPGATCYLLENGNLLRAGKDSLEIRDWNNNLIWSYATTANGIKQHHDIEPLPNGNILCIVGDNYTLAEMALMGRDTSNIVEPFRLDKVVELEPQGSNGANIVWEWSFVENLIQDFDITKENYGVVEEHPELLDINYDNGQTADFTHVNAVDYNSELNQVLITSRHLSELYIVNHEYSNSNSQQSTDEKFSFGEGFLWRWGNPEVYRQGNSDTQLLNKPHDGKWVESGYLDEGKISVFNNNGDSTETFSSVCLIAPSIEEGIYLKDEGKYLPHEFDWIWNGEIMGDTVYQKSRSGAQSLPNGNFLICETSEGRISEISKSGQLLWIYRNPSGQIIYNQYDEIPDNDNSIFRGEKYPSDYEGFNDQDMYPMGIIEDQNSISDSCSNVVTVEDIKEDEFTVVNPINNGRVQFSRYVKFLSVSIIDLSGKVVFETGYFEGNSISIELNPSIYILKMISEKKIRNVKIQIQ